MRKKICVIGKGVKVAHEFAEICAQLHGPDVVVLGGNADLEPVRTRAPAAVLIVLGGVEECRKAYEATCFPRARVFGLEDQGDLERALDAVLFERQAEFRVIALADGEFVPRLARLGRGGITALREG